MTRWAGRGRKNGSTTAYTRTISSVRVAIVAALTSGTFEFTDLDMIGFDGIKPGMHMTGKAVHDYLLAYVEKHKLGDRFRFKTKVVSAEWKGDRWALDLGDKGHVETAKFIVATGLTVRWPFRYLAELAVSSKHARARWAGHLQRAALPCSRGHCQI